MSKNIRIPVGAALCGLLAFTTSSLAQGTGFVYQGHFVDGAHAANGSYDFTFALFNASSGAGQAGGTLTDLAVGVTNGSFSVLLDFGANFPGADRWLEVSVRTNGGGAYTTLAPRQKLTPTPYAIYAGGSSASGLSGVISGSQIAPGSIGTPHLSNSVSFWSRTDNGIYYAAGDVGIGTPSPSRALEVRGGYADQFRITGGGDFGEATLDVSTSGAGAGWYSTIQSRSATWMGGASFPLCLNPNGGNVGIGTAGPGATLDVAGQLRIFSSPTNWAPPANGVLGSVGSKLILWPGVDDAGGTGGYPPTGLGVEPGALWSCVPGSGTFFKWYAGNPPAQIMSLSSSGDLNLVGGAHITSSGRLHLQSSAGQPLYLNPFVGGADVFIGGGGAAPNLQVSGEIFSQAVNLTSDRNAKEAFTPVNPRDVLEKVASLPITEWQYKEKDPNKATAQPVRHLGPMAQDFREAFALGPDDKHIATVDEGGVALAAIQGLNEKLEEKAREVEALKRSVAELRDLLRQLAAGRNGGDK